MKIIKQIGIIFTICWLSQVAEYLLPFDLPASIIGLVLLFLALLTGILQLKHIQDKSDFLLSNMAFFFVPAGVSLINYFNILKNSIVQIIVICLLSTILTFAATTFSIRLTVKLLDWRKQHVRTL